jgi:hypothetical protein
VEPDTDGYVVAAGSGSDIARASDPSAADGSAAGAPVPGSSDGEAAQPGPAASAPPSPRVGLLALDGGVTAPLAGVGSLLVVAIGSVALTVIRRRLVQRRVAERTIARLARLAGPNGQP